MSKYNFIRGVRTIFSKHGLKFFLSRVPSIVFWATISTVMLTLGQGLYERNVSGDYLLNVQSATVEKKVAVGEQISFSFCRKPRYDGIVSDRNIRTFYLLEDGRRIPVDQRILPDVAYEVTTDPCIVIDINPINAPQIPGRYKFCQQITFNAWGYEKQANFCSTEWELVPAADAPNDTPTAQ